MTTLLEFETNSRGRRVYPQPQAVASKGPTEEQLTAAEAERQQRRADIRHKIAAGEMAEQQRLKIVAAIDDRNAQKEAVASEHCIAAAPLQARLKALESQQIANIVARLPADPELETEREGLLHQLREMNATLKATIDRHDEILRQLEVERLEAAKRCCSSALQTELIESGRPDLVAKMRVTNSTVSWAKARLQKAESFHRERRNPYSRAELEAASEALTKAEAEAREALAAVLEE